MTEILPSDPESTEGLPKGYFFVTYEGESASIRDIDGAFYFILEQVQKEPLLLEITKEQYRELKEAKQKNAVEIEKKFLVEELPEDLQSYPHTMLEQSYLIIDIGNEVRIREKNKDGKKSYTLTIKSGNNEIRGEYQAFLTEQQYIILKARQVNNSIRKYRFEIPDKNSGRTIELDIFLDNGL